MQKCTLALTIGSVGVVVFANATDLPVIAVDGLGHMLGTDYVGNI
jgi:hypothetical protein